MCHRGISVKIALGFAPEDWIREAYGLLRNMLLHEFDEMLLVNGHRCWDPHLKGEERVPLADALSSGPSSLHAYTFGDTKESSR